VVEGRGIEGDGAQRQGSAGCRSAASGSQLDSRAYAPPVPASTRRDPPVCVVEWWPGYRRVLAPAERSGAGLFPTEEPRAAPHRWERSVLGERVKEYPARRSVELEDIVLREAGVERETANREPAGRVAEQLVVTPGCESMKTSSTPMSEHACVPQIVSFRLPCEER